MSGADAALRGLVRQWLDKAEEDFAAAEFLVSRDAPYPHVVAFHAQQAAEKYLKAYLTWRQVEFPKTHDLNELLDLVGSVDAALARALQEADELTPFGVDVRYPGVFPKVTAEVARRALQVAGEIRARVLDSLEREVEPGLPRG
jgi:HEPN domain-containing protein